MKNELNKNERIGVVIQAIYGNRTFMMLKKDEIDMYILGYLDTEHFKKYYKEDKIDRTVVRLPGAEHLALIYNKKKELKSLANKEKHFQETGREMKPLAEIPELGLTLYSRCLVCRIDADGEPASLEEGDGEVVTKYLAE